MTRNLMNSYRGSTVLFITHVWGSRGFSNSGNGSRSLVEQGSHDELMDFAGITTLFTQQEFRSHE